MTRQDTVADPYPQRLRDELTDTAVVERATGVLMQQAGAGAETARAQLAHDAARAGRTLPGHCARVLAEVTRNRGRHHATSATPERHQPVRRRQVTADPVHARDELSVAFRTTIRMTASAPDRLYRLDHTDAGPFQAGEYRLPGRLSYTSEPAPQLVIAELTAGTVEQATGADEERLTAGDVFITGRPAAAHSAVLHHTRVRTATLPLPLIHKAAGELPGQGQPLRFTCLRPATPALADQWRSTRRYLGELLDGPGLDAAAPLLVDATARLLAATALAVFPNTATDRPDTRCDRTDATRASVRRATTYIDEHAEHDISLTDIAAAAHVTPRALQYAFRRHLDTTPLGYLREVRLHRAHRDLLDADPEVDTVTEIAARWGFLHPGRFAGHYQDLYHCRPSATLHA